MRGRLEIPLVVGLLRSRQQEVRLERGKVRVSHSSVAARAAVRALHALDPHKGILGGRPGTC